MKIVFHSTKYGLKNVSKIKDAYQLSLLSVMIPKDDIFKTYIIQNNRTELRNFIDSIIGILSLDDVTNSELIWHLRDNITLRPNFWDKIRYYSNLYDEMMHDSYYIFCGARETIDDNKMIGDVSPNNMFHSFDCIGIPLWVTEDFIKWVDKNKDKSYITGSLDDIFKKYLSVRSTLGEKISIHNMPRSMVESHDSHFL